MTPLSCHPEARPEPTTEAQTVALVGNPNVGKSTIFNDLTGLNALTTNYPGTTVEVAIGTVMADGRRVQLIDLPGTYGVAAAGEDQRAAWDVLLGDHPDAVLAVADATNLARNLYLILQLLDFGLPVVVALNMSDAAHRGGLRIDAAHLAGLLGVPVLPTVATKGRGLRAALEAAARQRAVARSYRYGAETERVVTALTAGRSEAEAFQLLDRGIAGTSSATLRDAETCCSALKRFETAAGERASTAVARDRHALAERLARTVTVGPADLRGRTAWRIATHPVAGSLLLAGVLAAVFAALFWGGTILAGLLDRTWAAYVSPVIRAVVTAAAGSGTVGRTVLWGLDAGLNAVLSVGIPYVLTFYLMLAVLEDTGYLNAAALILDRTLGRMGLTGRAAIPLVAGAGCNVPAIIGLRVLRTERERFIAGTLITLVPCSARTAVIFGAVAALAGPGWAVLLYAVVAVVILGAGWGLNRVLPGASPALLMEMFPFRVPSPRTVLRKSWFRVREFAFVAVPIVLAGSVLLGALYETGVIRLAARPLAPIVEGWLGLPAIAGLTLVFAVLRKELALQLLFALALVEYGRGAASLLAFMTPRQIFTYALVNTLYIPCAATIAVLTKALGWRRAALISGGTITLAVLLGGLVTRLLALVLP